MPTYEFQCDECGEYAQVKAPMNAIPYTVLCACGNDMRRLYSIPQITIRYGSGDLMDRASKGIEQPPGWSKEDTVRVADSMDQRRH